MKIIFSRKTELDNSTFEPETWYYIMADTQCLKATKNEDEAKRYHAAAIEYYRSNGTMEPITEIISETEIKTK